MELLCCFLLPVPFFVYCWRLRRETETFLLLFVLHHLKLHCSGIWLPLDFISREEQWSLLLLLRLQLGFKLGHRVRHSHKYALALIKRPHALALLVVQKVGQSVFDGADFDPTFRVVFILFIVEDVLKSLQNFSLISRHLLPFFDFILNFMQLVYMFL